MIVNKKYHFYAAHRNPAGGEKCGRIHGHTYYVECDFMFNECDENGITCLFSDIDSKVEPIVKDYCHWFIIYKNDPLCKILIDNKEQVKIVDFITSAENLSKHIYERIRDETGLPIIKITLQETKSSRIIYEIKS